MSVHAAHDAVRPWASALGARGGTPRTVRRGRRLAGEVTDFRVGRRVVVSLDEVDGLGHGWSGGDGRRSFGDPEGPDASRLIWRFVDGRLRAGRRRPARRLRRKIDADAVHLVRPAADGARRTAPRRSRRAELDRRAVLAGTVRRSVTVFASAASPARPPPADRIH